MKKSDLSLFCFFEENCKCKNNKNIFKFHQFGKHIDDPKQIKNIFIYGPHGTGKAYLIEQLKKKDFDYIKKNKNIELLFFDQDYIDNFVLNDHIMNEVEFFLKNSSDKWDIDYFKKTTELKTHDNLSQKKVIALFWFFICSKEKIINDKTDTKYILVLKNLSDYLDFFDNFLVDFFVFEFIKKYGLKNKIHSLLFLSHKITFLNFFINEDGNKNDTRLFRIFNDTQRFLIELETYDLIKTDYLLFSNVMHSYLFLENKTNEFENNISKIIFWSLSRKVMESIMTSIINIKNFSSINAHRRGSFSQFYKYIEWLYKDEKDEIKKNKLITFLKKWKFIQKTSIENDQVKWYFENQSIKDIFDIFVDFFYKLKFIDDLQLKEFNIAIKKLEIDGNFSVSEKELKVWLEKNYQSLRDDSDKGKLQNINYKRYFLVNYSYTILSLLKKEYPHGNHFSRHSNSTHHHEEHKAFVLIRHAGNNLFPYIFSYDKEFFDNFLKLIS